MLSNSGLKKQSWLVKFLFAVMCHHNFTWLPISRITTLSMFLSVCLNSKENVYVCRLCIGILVAAVSKYLISENDQLKT